MSGDTNNSTRVIIYIDGKMYDMTAYLDGHPGGRDALLRHNKHDASSAFMKQRAHHFVMDFIKTKLKTYYVGDQGQIQS